MAPKPRPKPGPATVRYTLKPLTTEQALKKAMERKPKESKPKPSNESA